MTNKVKQCPICKGDELRTFWTANRMLQQTCNDSNDIDCGWQGEPFVPKKKPIKTTKTVYTDAACWVYEIFDQYGYTCAYSQDFGSKKACMAAAKKEIKRQNECYGKCTAIIWAPSAILRGIKVK